MLIIDSLIANLFFFSLMGFIKVVVPIIAVYIPLCAFAIHLSAVFKTR